MWNAYASILLDIYILYSLLHIRPWNLSTEMNANGSTGEALQYHKCTLESGKACCILKNDRVGEEEERNRDSSDAL